MFDEILTILTKLRSTSGRLEKEAILRNISSPVVEHAFKQVVTYAYNPYHNFYVRKFKQPEKTTGTSSFDDMIAHLDYLRNRMITGNAAIEATEDLAVGIGFAGTTVLRHILEGDLDCGCGLSTFNKIWPGLVPTFELQQCHTYDEKTSHRVKWDEKSYWAQLKYDAARVAIIVNIQTDSVSYRTRNGLTYQIEDADLDRIFLEAAKALDRPSLVFDGELYQINKSTGKPESRTVSNGVATKLIRGTAALAHSQNIGMSLWDVIPAEMFAKGKCTTPYSKRFELIEQMFGNGLRVKPAETTVVSSEDEALALAAKYMKAGEEGIILKDPDGIWEAKRSYATLKIKAVREADLEIIGFEEGEGKYAGSLGALICSSSCGRVLVNVGTGISDNDRRSIWAQRAKLKGTIATIRYNELIKGRDSDTYSLFLPRLVELRPDKDVADDLKKIKAGT